MKTKNLFDDNVHKETIARLDQLTPTSEAQWGKMNIGQMLHHCQKPLEIVLEKNDHGLKSNLLAKIFFKKTMYNDKPWSKGLPTPKSFRVIAEKNFETEKNKLKALLDEFHAQRLRKEWPDHPVFGHFSAEQVGKMQYKHLDHHLRQFGV